jgi:osmotically-inducible protein OsmY
MQIVKSDAQIQKDVLEELRWDTRIAATEVGVEVDKGIVTLTGTVENYGKKLAAREAAHRVAGVLDVADDVQIIVPGSGIRTDTDIAEAVRRALTWDSFVPEDRVQSTVSNGFVTLTGELDFWNQRADAEDAIRNLNGVKGVINDIRLSAPKVQPQIVRKSIEDALERRAQREAQRITVQVEDGAVTLSGDVQNWAEKSAIQGAAAHAPGVRSVKNELRIVPSL